MATPRKVLMRNPIQLPWNTTDSAPETALLDDDGVADDKTFETEVVNEGEGLLPVDEGWDDDADTPAIWALTASVN